MASAAALADYLDEDAPVVSLASAEAALDDDSMIVNVPNLFSILFPSAPTHCIPGGQPVCPRGGRGGGGALGGRGHAAVLRDHPRAQGHPPLHPVTPNSTHLVE